MDGAGPPRLSRRAAVRLLAGGLVAGAACTSGGRRVASPPGADTTTSTLPPTTTSTLPPTTTTTVANGPLAGFVAFGDSGGGPAQFAVAAAMGRWAATHRVDALVTTGDNVYDFGEPHHFYSQLDAPYRDLRAPSAERPGGRPLWATLGNHDVVRGHGPAQLAHLGLPALPYATELAGVRFLFLDTSAAIAPQTSWLDTTLAAPGPAVSVAVFHAPVHSCGLHGPYQPVADAWAPVLEARRATLVLNGHDHLYHRYLSAGGVTYLVTGGGGRDLYAHTPGCGGPDLLVSHVRHHFVGVEVYAERVVLTAVADDDTVLDTAELAVAPAPVGVGAGPQETAPGAAG